MIFLIGIINNDDGLSVIKLSEYTLFFEKNYHNILQLDDT